MYYTAIKFKFDYIHNDRIDDVFDNVKHLLNFQFDNDSNLFFIDSDVNYQFKDVSYLDCEDIEIIINSFFDFIFEDIFNVFFI